jgi:hypothetical protein
MTATPVYMGSFPDAGLVTKYMGAMPPDAGQKDLGPNQDAGTRMSPVYMAPMPAKT